MLPSTTSWMGTLFTGSPRPRSLANTVNALKKRTVDDVIEQDRWSKRPLASRAPLHPRGTMAGEQLEIVDSLVTTSSPPSRRRPRTRLCRRSSRSCNEICPSPLLMVPPCASTSTVDLCRCVIGAGRRLQNRRVDTPSYGFFVFDAWFPPTPFRAAPGGDRHDGRRHVSFQSQLYADGVCLSLLGTPDQSSGIHLR